jgi:hypothetical protein
MNLLGRNFLVDFGLLQNFLVTAEGRAGDVELTFQGQIMESAKVFHHVEVAVDHFKIIVCIYACLPFWNRGGSPDFVTKRHLNLVAGGYDVCYGNLALALKPVTRIIVSA